LTGGNGYSREFRSSACTGDARAITEIYEGTSEIQAAGDCGLGVEELLELPVESRELKVDSKKLRPQTFEDCCTFPLETLGDVSL